MYSSQWKTDWLRFIGNTFTTVKDIKDTKTEVNAKFKTQSGDRITVCYSEWLLKIEEQRHSVQVNTVLYIL